jgi:hypothetical protein
MWKYIFKTDISNIKINNKSKSYENMPDDLIKKIRNHPLWKSDYDFFDLI